MTGRTLAVFILLGAACALLGFCAVTSNHREVLVAFCVAYVTLLVSFLVTCCTTSSRSASQPARKGEHGP